MNIGAIDLTVGAHDARNAVQRLALLVSDPRAAPLNQALVPPERRQDRPVARKRPLPGGCGLVKPE